MAVLIKDVAAKNKGVINKKAINLDSVKPSAKELAAAKQILESGSVKENKSRMACMSAFAKKMKDKDAASSRGGLRQRYLEAYVVLQARLKETDMTVESEHTAQTDHQCMHDVHWWSAEKMDLEIGRAKAEHWRASGIVPHQPDSITGSKEPEHIEWGVPQNWARMTIGDLRRLSLKTTAGAEEEDIELVKDAANLFDPLSREAPEDDEKNPLVAIKEEAKDPEEEKKQIVKEKIDLFLQNGQSCFRQHQDMCLEAKVLKTKVENDNNKYTQSFVEDLACHIRKIEKLLKILEKLVTAGVNDESAMPKLIDTIEETQVHHANLLDWAERFGFHATNTAKKKKK